MKNQTHCLLNYFKIYRFRFISMKVIGKGGLLYRSFLNLYCQFFLNLGQTHKTYIQ